jgi:hypothetical protein
MTEGNLVSFRVDFNAVDQHGWVKTRRQFSGLAVGALQAGLVVLMNDHDDNSAMGVIREVSNTLVRLEPIWPTWKTGFRLTSVPIPQLALATLSAEGSADSHWVSAPA